MVTGNNYRFGHKVWIDILVENPSTIITKPMAEMKIDTTEPVVCNFIAEAVSSIKDNMLGQMKSEYPDIEMESQDKAGGEEESAFAEPALNESALNQSIRESGLQTPKQIYTNKVAEVEDKVARQALNDLFDLGFVNFDVNKAMLIKYKNDTQVVAGYLCEGILSDSGMQAVFK